MRIIHRLNGMSVGRSVCLSASKEKVSQSVRESFLCHKKYIVCILEQNTFT